MANTLAVAFDIDTPAAPVEISINNGASWAPLTVPAAGNHKTANLLNVPAGFYDIGFIQLRGVGYSISVVKNLASVTIVDAATGTATQLAAPANTSAVASGATAMSVTASSVPYNNGYKLYRSTASAGTFAVVATIAAGNPPTVADGGLTASTSYFYQWQTLGNGTTYTDSALGAVFSGTTLAVSNDTLTLTTQDFSYTGYDIDAGTYRKRSALASVKVQADATQFELRLVNPQATASFYSTPGAIISIFDSAGIFVSKVQATTAAGVQVLLTSVLPASASFTFVEGGATQTSATTFEGTYLQSIRRVNGTSLVKSAPVRAANRVAFGGDSINVGYNATDNSRYAYLVRLRTLLGSAYEVMTTGFGANYAGGWLSTPALRQAEADRVVAYCAGATAAKIYVDTLGTNDFGYMPGDPVTVAGYKSDVWDRIRAADPAITVLSGTPLFRGNKDQPNSLNKVLADYAAAFTTQANQRNTFVRAVDCLPWLTTPDFGSDVLHPTDDGHNKVAAKWFEAITGRAINPVIQVAETVQEDDPRIVYSAGWIRNDTPQFGVGAIFHGGALRYTQTPGARATFPTAGTQVQFNVYTESGSGTFDLQCNGAVVGSYSLYSANTVNNVSIISAVVPVGSGPNSFAVVKTGTDSSNVYIDEIVITNGTLTPSPGAASASPPTSAPASSATPVTYRDLAANLSTTPGTLTVVSAGALFGGLARGTQAIASASDGYTEFSSPVAGSDVMAGLHSGATMPTSWTQLAYVIYRHNDNTVTIYEAGVEVIPSPFIAGSAGTDVYRIARVGNSIVYSINGGTIRTVAAPTAQYYPVAALNAVGNKLTNGTIQSPAALVTY